MKLFQIIKKKQQQFLSDHPRLQEKLGASLGAFAAILVLMLTINQLQLTLQMEILVLASMGASTFLLFVVPHSPMAQPWPLMAGHLIAAICGVSCHYWIADPVLATAIAVGLSVFAMHSLHALHPPAAATAMIAVLALPELDEIAWYFVYQVVMMNAGILLILALIINNLLPGRRYPLRHVHHEHHAEFISQAADKRVLTEADFEYALLQINAVIDISATDLVDLYEFAIEHADQQQKNSH